MSKKHIPASELKKLGITKLKEIAKDLKIKGYTKFRKDTKADLEKLILASGSKPKAKAKPKAKELKSPVLAEIPDIDQKVPKKKTPQRITKKITQTLNERKAKSKQQIKSNCIDRSKLGLKRYQVKPIKHIMTHRGIVLNFGTGTGKTLTAATASQCLLDAHPDKKVLVVTSKSLQDNFKKEMKAYGVRNTRKYKFYTYEKFSIDYKKKPATTLKTSCKDRILIIDEAHNLRSPKGQRSHALIQCAKAAFKVILLTATPAVNKITDVLNLVAMVDGTNPMSEAEFKNLSPTQRRRYLSCVFSYYMPKRSDLKDFPKVKEHNLLVPMNRDYYKQYRDVEKYQIQKMPVNVYRGSEQGIWAFLTGVRIACNALKLTDNEKFNIVSKLVKIYKKKIVIYSSWKLAGVNLLIDKLKRDNNVSVGAYTGDTSVRERTKLVNRYNAGKLDVLIITKAGGEGLDLKGTKALVIFDPVWNPSTESQIVGRTARYKSHSHLPKNRRIVNVFKLYSTKPKKGKRDRKGLIRDPKDNRPSADMILKGIVDKKRDIIKQITSDIKSVSIERVSC